MKRAWMPATAVLVTTILLIGCDPGAMGVAWTRWESAFPTGHLISDPISNRKADSTNRRTESKPSDEAGSLAEQVDNFLAQFPPDDNDRRHATNHAPAQPAAVQPPPPGFVRNQPRLGIVGPLAEPMRATAANPQATSAMSPIQVRPSSVQTETAASPVPPDVYGPVPSPPAKPSVELIEVRAAKAPAGTSTQPAVPGANQPVMPASPGPANGLDAVLAQLEGAIKLHPQQVDDQFRLRLLYAATGQEDRATGPLEGVDPVQAELVSAVLRAVVAVRKSMLDPVGASTQAVAATEELRRLLGQQSAVIVPRLALVTRVNSFGDYDAVNPPRFEAGQPVHVFLYTEVKNFRSEAASDNRLRTVLAEKVEIFDASGKVIWQRAEPTIEDRAHSPRTDFFMTMELELPSDMPAGEYVLKVTVEDKLGATTDQQRLSFTIAAK